jgi:hypothetical protein
MDKLTLFLNREEAEVLLEALQRITQEQEEVRKEATKKIATCFALQNMLEKNNSQSD